MKKTRGMIQLPPMEENEALTVLVALETLHQGLTNLPESPRMKGLPRDVFFELVKCNVRVSNRLRTLTGMAPMVCIGEIQNRIGANMVSATDALCALLVKRLEQMPQRADLTQRVAAEIKQLEGMWRATKQLGQKEHESR